MAPLAGFSALPLLIGMTTGLYGAIAAMSFCPI